MGSEGRRLPEYHFTEETPRPMDMNKSSILQDTEEVQVELSDMISTLKIGKYQKARQ